MQKGLTDKDRRRRASNECQALRDLVNKLKLELLQSQMVTQKIHDQLQCVIYLVRRAWQGDEIASIHVSNIVGVAPPKIQRSSDLNTFTATPKSRALNGWARLVIGLLNRMYCDEELELRAKQLLYMRDKEELLDEQLLLSHKDVMQHQTNVTLVHTNTLQLLQAREEEKAHQRAQEREQLEEQKQELQAKFRRRLPHTLHSHGSVRKDSVQREVKLDLSEDLLVRPVRSRKEENDYTEVDDARHVNSAQRMKDETTSADASSAADLAESEQKSSNDVFLTRRRSSSLSRDEANLPKKKDQGSKHHTRSQTSEGAGKKTNLQPKPRPKTATVKSSSTGGGSGVAAKTRPLSAHLSQPKPWSKPPPAFDTSKTKRQLDLIERDLKRTTKTLQDRLGISKQGFV